jgi:hypothetical protein
MAASAVKGFASSQHSASAAHIIGISADIAADNKLSSSSQKLIIELMFLHTISQLKKSFKPGN